MTDVHVMESLFIDAIGLGSLDAMSSREILRAHRSIHQCWKEGRDQGDRLIAAHTSVFVEMEKREMRHQDWDDLDSRCRELVLQETIALHEAFNAVLFGDFQEQDQSFVIQTLILSKSRFPTLSSARKWVRDHNFKTRIGGKGPDETPNNWRFRQEDPGKFKPNSFRTIRITDGVQATGGRLDMQDERDKPDETRPNGARFALQHRFWRGQRALDLGASKEVWDLRLAFPDERKSRHWILGADPRKKNIVRVILAAPASLDTLEIGSGGAPEMIEAGTPGLNKEGNPPAFVELIDQGSVRILDDSRDFKRYEFGGNTLSGAWTLIRKGGPNERFELRRQSRKVEAA